MRRILSTIRARAGSGIASRAMLTVLLTSIGLLVVGFLVVWAVSS